MEGPINFEFVDATAEIQERLGIKPNVNNPEESTFMCVIDNIHLVLPKKTFDMQSFSNSQLAQVSQLKYQDEKYIMLLFNALPYNFWLSPQDNIAMMLRMNQIYKSQDDCALMAKLFDIGVSIKGHGPLIRVSNEKQAKYMVNERSSLFICCRDEHALPECATMFTVSNYKDEDSSSDTHMSDDSAEKLNKEAEQQQPKKQLRQRGAPVVPRTKSLMKEQQSSSEDSSEASSSASDDDASDDSSEASMKVKTTTTSKTTDKSRRAPARDTFFNDDKASTRKTTPNLELQNLSRSATSSKKSRGTANKVAKSAPVNSTCNMYQKYSNTTGEVYLKPLATVELITNLSPITYRTYEDFLNGFVGSLNAAESVGKLNDFSYYAKFTEKYIHVCCTKCNRFSVWIAPADGQGMTRYVN